MRQSRLAVTATKSLRSILFTVRRNKGLSFQQGFAESTASAARPGDPEVFSKERDREINSADPSGEPEETQEHYEPETNKPQRENNSNYRLQKQTEPLSQHKPPTLTASRLKSTEVTNPSEPNRNQTRKNTTSIIEDINCVGFDGTPLSEAANKKSKEDQIEEDNEYYKEHKASPLSEIELADTRKPITRATDGTADSGPKYGDVIRWLPEQLDTAEESMERARRIWLENAMRGDPSSPHGRVLRELRGEWF